MRLVCRSSLILGALALAPSPVAASLVVTATQSSVGVAIVGSGDVALGGLTADGPGSVGSSGLFPASAALLVSGDNDGYIGLAGPVSFGSGGASAPSTQAGDAFVLLGGPGFIGLPRGYVSRQSLSTSLTFAGATFASLGLASGTYTYSFGSGSDADTVVVQVGATETAIPEPATATLAAAAVATLLLVRRENRSRL